MLRIKPAKYTTSRRTPQPAGGLFLILFLALALASCNPARYLAPEDYLLRGNSIKLYDKGDLDRKRAMKYELSTLYKQTENNRFFFIPREWFYFATQGKGDTTKFDRWQQRVIAEEPALYDPQLREATERSMRYYLQYQGYFNAEVYSDPLVKGKKIYITYHVTPNERFTVDSIGFYSADPVLDSTLQAIAGSSLLRAGSPVDGALFEQERKRITNYLRNHGYAYFFNNYITALDADTTSGKQQANLSLEVLPPAQDSLHQQYWVDDITIFADYSPGQSDSLALDSLIGGVRMLSPRESFRIKPETILDAIFLKKGMLYSQADYDLTNKQLTGMGVYRFVRIKQEPDPDKPNHLDFRIELTQNKRMELGADLEFNYASRSATGVGNLIGLAASPSFRNRNLFHGAELLITDFNAGVEFNPAPSAIAQGKFWNTVDLGLQANLYLPRFIDYLGIWRRLSKPKGRTGDPLLFRKGFYQSLQENASTRISANYNYLLILDFYRYNLFTGTYGFDHQPAANRRFIFNHIGLDYLLPTTDENFEALLNFNPFLANSFGEQLFVSLLFRDLNYVYNSRPNRRGNSYYFGVNVELAGAEVWAGNAIYNSFALEADTLRLNLRGEKAVDFSQYARTQVDLRRYWQGHPNRSWSARLSLGVARPFGYTSDVPYVKQFFAGGPNSLRAWAPRGLGPGAYEDTLAVRSANNTRLYQTGDFKLEANLEYRFKIFWLMHGAFFLDAGNVWTLRQDPNRCGSQFLLRPRNYACTDQETGEKISYTNEAFYKQIAIGGGFGIRLDFSYFILRLDMAVKLRHAAPFPDIPDDGQNWRNYWFRDFRPDGNRVPLRFSDIVAFNLGFGYPF